MRKIIWVALISLLLLPLFGCSEKSSDIPIVEDDNGVDVIDEEERYTFLAYIQEINEDMLLVMPNDSTGQMIAIPISATTDGLVPALGDLYEVTHDGGYLKSLPLQLNAIYEMRRVKNAGENYVMGTIRRAGETYFHILDADDLDAIVAVFVNNPWYDGISDCVGDYEYHMIGIRYEYSVSCGVASDLRFGRNTKLSEGYRLYVNDLMERFVSRRQ